MTTENQSKRYRVVLDVNVIISAVHFGGHTAALLRLVSEGYIDLCLSHFILDKTVSILRKRFDWPQDRCTDLVQLLREISTIVYPVHRIDLIKEDDSNNRIIECAVTTEAQFVISGGKHLLKHTKHNNVSILAPADFLKNEF